MGPDRFCSRCDAGKGNFDAAGILGLFPDIANQLNVPFGHRFRELFEQHGFAKLLFRLDDIVDDMKPNAIVGQVVQIERRRSTHGRVPRHHRMHATACTTGQDRRQVASRFFGKGGRETRDDDKVIRFRHLAGGSVVFFDGVKLAAKIRLKDVLHMDSDLQQLVTNLRTVRPDAAVDQ